MTDFIDIEAFRAEVRRGHQPTAGLYKLAPNSEPQLVEGTDARKRRYVWSSERADHDGDVIKQSGWDTSVFASNPIALFNHSSWAVIGRASNFGVMNNKLQGDIEFAGPEIPLAETVYQLVKGGWVRATSVGFIPKKFRLSSDKNRPFGLDILEQLLIEISVVSIPANPDALIQARGMGVDTRPLAAFCEEALDRGAALPMMSRRDLEGLRRQAGASERKFYTSTKAGARLSVATRAAIEGAMTHHQAGLDCLKGLLDDGDGSDDPPGSVEQDPAAKRLAELAQLRHSLAAPSLAERVRYAAELKAEVEADAARRRTTPEERVRAATELQRQLRSEGLI